MTKPSKKTPLHEQHLERALDYESRAYEMKKVGDLAAEKSFRRMADAWLEEAVSADPASQAA